jgi:uncharacterized repeat protein (TIGR01451 family)
MTPARSLTGIAVVAAGALLAVPAVSSSAAAEGNSNDKQTICHATNSDTNQYVVITPNKNGDVDGHAGHTGPVWNPTLKAQHISWGDIIPPFTYNDHGETKQFPGQNWTTEGRAFFDNGCRVPITATVDKTNDANGDAAFSDDETATAEGAAVPFSVTVTNTSAVPAVVVSLTDTVSGQPVTFTPSPDPVGTTLAPGATTTFTFTVSGYSPANGASKVNTVTATLADKADDTNTGRASDTSTVRTVLPDVAVLKTGPASVAPGDTVTYTITVSNTGTVPAAGVVVTDTLPTGTTLVSATGTGWTSSGTTSLTLTYGPTLAAGASSTPVTVVVRLDQAFSGTSIANTAVVTPADVTPADNTSTATTTVVQPGGGGGGGGAGGGGGGGGEGVLPTPTPTDTDTPPFSGGEGGGSVALPSPTPSGEFTGGGGGLPLTGANLLLLLLVGGSLLLTGGAANVLLKPKHR